MSQRKGRSTLPMPVSRKPYGIYEMVAQILTGDPSATANDGVAWVQELCDALQAPPLADCGVTRADFPVLIEKSSISSSMRGNPIKLTGDELEEILTRAL